MKLSLAIITKNEEKNIKDCILSAKELVDEIIVVDDYSEDNTRKIAQGLGAKIYQRKLGNFSSQKNYLISQASSPWIFLLDADERADERLKFEIKKAINDSSVDGYKILRKNFIFEKELKYGGNANDWVLRIFKKDKARFINPVHEELKLEGAIDKLKEGAILHYSTPNLSTYFKKLKIYTNLEASFLKKKKTTFFYLLLGPIFEFIKRYFFQKGFLDGKEGLLFYSLSAYYVFLKYAKLILKRA